MSVPHLELRKVSLTYGHVRALNEVSMSVDKGSIVALIGSNGAGKSSTLRAITGLRAPQRGEVLLDGESTRGVAPHKLVERGVAMVPEGRHVFPYMSVKDNLLMGAYTRRDKGVGADMEKVFGYFPKLRQRIRQQAGTLSGGEQQMLAIARALLLRPRLLLLDEPSFGLAPLIVQEIFEIMQRINREEGTSILVVEQNANLALSIADTAYLLETGRIMISGPADEIGRDESVRRSYLGY